ncbi:MAG: hypothetical protein WC554_00940 [Clostridia bacterium]|jgi:hypothetical protein
MRFLVVIFSIFTLETGWLLAGSLDKVVLKSDQKTAVANQVNSPKITGYIERIDIKFSETTMPVDLRLISSNILSETSTVLFDSDSISTNVSFYPRLNGHDSSGAVAFTNDGQRYCVLDEVIYMIITNSVTNAQTTLTTIIYKHE